MSNKVKLTIDRPEPGMIIAHLAGQADHTQQGYLHQQAERILNEAPKQLILDLADLQFIASKFIGDLIQLRNHIHADGGHMHLCGLRGEVQRTCSMLNLHQVFTIYPNCADAIAQRNPIDPHTMTDPHTR